MHRIRLTALGLVLVAAAATVLAKQQVVVLKDGREFTGEVTKTPEGYRVQTRLAVLTFRADEVASVTDVKTPQDEYEQRLAKIDPKDANARLALAQWAHKKGLLEIARKELNEALKLDGELEMAKLLLRRVNAELARAAESRPATRPPDGSKPRVESPKIPAEWLVTQEDIYRIRMAEFKLPDDPSGIVDTSGTVRFRNDVIERFIRLMQGRLDDFDATRFRAQPSFEKLTYILTQTKDESIRGDLLLGRDCKVLSEFRTRIWPVVANRCGALICHGAPRGRGQLKLLNVGARTERIDYANFLILNMYAKGATKMLNRDKAEDSLLLHYGLPLDYERLKYPHPGKKPIPVAFATVSDRNYQAIEKWIGSLRGPPLGGHYEVKYQPPFGPKVKPRAVLEVGGAGEPAKPE